MKNLLSQIWNGQVCPFEECDTRDTRTREIQANIDRCREKLSRGMDAAQTEALEDFESSLYDLVNHNMEKSFIKGVEFAFGLLTEALG